jgi:ABC-type polysaccharide/polyol phosphate transport system ATPase subunit
MSLGEIGRRLEEIADFAGLAGVLDVPVKHYSTGMAVRLGFAVATATRPAVLLVDEVLAVGDEEFRRRCTLRVRELRAGGTAVLLASHDLGLVEREADQCLFLAQGTVRAIGAPAQVVTEYRRGLAS